MQSEQLCQMFTDWFQISTCSLRIFSAYGEGLKRQLFWDMYQALLTSGHTLHPQGTGLETRYFIHVDDIVRAIHLCMSNSEFQGECINIGSGVGTPVQRAIEIFLSHFPRKINIEFSGQSR